MGEHDETQVNAVVPSGADPTPSPKARRSLMGRVLRWTGGTIAVLAIVAGGAAAWGFSDSGQEMVRGQVEAALTEQTGAPATLKRLSYGTDGRLSLGDLTLRTAENTPLLRLDSLSVDLEPGSLISGPIHIRELRIAGVHATPPTAPADAEEAPAEAAPTDPPPDRDIIIDIIAIEDISIQTTTADGKTLSVTGLALRGGAKWDATAQALRGELTMTMDLLRSVRPDGRATEIRGLSMPIAMDAGPSGGGATLGPITAEVYLERPEKPALTQQFALQSLKVERDAAGVIHALGGALTLDDIRVDALVATLNPADPTAPLELALGPILVPAKTLNALSGKETLASDIRATIGAKGTLDALIVNGTLDTDGGTFKLSGTADLATDGGPRWDLKLRGEGIDTAALLVDPPAPLKTGLTMTFSGSGQPPDDMRADLNIQIDAGTVGGHAFGPLTMVGRLDERGLVLEKLRAEILGQKVAIAGTFDPKTGQAKANLNTEADLAEVLDALAAQGLLPAALPGIRGDSVTVDLALTGLVDPMTDPNAPQPPIKNATAKGRVQAKGVGAGDASVGSADIALDVQLVDGAPKGTAVLTLSDIQAPGLRIPKLRVDVTLDGAKHRVEISGHDEATGLALKAAGTLELDPPNDVHLALTMLEITRGERSLSLAEPVHISLPSTGLRGQDIPLNDVVLRTGDGGEMRVDGRVTMTDTEVPRIGNVGLKLSLKNFSARALPLPPKLARALRKAQGRTTGSVDLHGDLTAPSVGFEINHRIKGFRIALVGSVIGEDAEATIRVTKGRMPIASGALSAQLKADRKGINPNAALRVSLDTRELNLARLGVKLPPKAQGVETVQASLQVSGSLNRPRGRLSVTTAGTDHQASVDSTFKAEDGGLRSTNRVDVQHRGATAKAEAVAGLKRWPPRKRGTPDWDLSLTTEPLNLGDWARAAAVPPSKAPMGSASLALNASGRGSALADAQAAIILAGVQSPTAKDLAPLDILLGAFAGASAEQGLALSVNGEVRAAGTLLVQLMGGAGESGQLKHLGRDAKSGDLPIALHLTIPERRLVDLGAVHPKIGSLPGQISAAVHVSGTSGAPVASAMLTFGGLRTLNEAPFDAQVTLNADVKTAGFALSAGTSDAGTSEPDAKRLSISAETAMPPLLARLRGEESTTDPMIALRILAKELNLNDLIPTTPATAGLADLLAVLDSDLNAEVTLPRKKGALPSAKWTGGLKVESAKLPLANSGRVLHDVALALTGDNSAIRWAIDAKESDEHRENRWAKVSGGLDFAGGLPTLLELDIASEDFLAMGALDAPEGEIDANIAIRADLSKALATVDINIMALDIWSPSRWPRDHYPTVSHMGDVVEIESESAVGTLVAKPEPPLNAIAADPPTGWTMPTAVAFPPQAIDIRIHTDGGIHVVKSPIELMLTGALNLAVRGKAIRATGGFEATDGTFFLSGQPFAFERGFVKADGALADLHAQFRFARATQADAARDMTDTEDHTTQRVQIDVIPRLGKPRLTFSGSGGPYMPDHFGVMLAGHAIKVSGPGLPTSSQNALPHGEMHLILAFVSNHIQHALLFERSLGWSEPGDLSRENYGRMRNMALTHALMDGRLRLDVGQNPWGLVRNEGELGLDVWLNDDPRHRVGLGLRGGTSLMAAMELFYEFSSEH